MMASAGLRQCSAARALSGRYVVSVWRPPAMWCASRCATPRRRCFCRPWGRSARSCRFMRRSAPSAVARAVEGAAWWSTASASWLNAVTGDFARMHGEGAGQPRPAGRSRRRHAPRADLRHRRRRRQPQPVWRSKAAGEAAVRAALPQAVILRPSIVFGAEDQFFNRFAALAQFSPVMPVISGDSKFQPVYVGDVADAVMAAAGPQATARPTSSAARKSGASANCSPISWPRPAGALPDDVPMGLARLQASILQHLPGKPLTTDQIFCCSATTSSRAGRRALRSWASSPTPIELDRPQLSARVFGPGNGRADQQRRISGPDSDPYKTAKILTVTARICSITRSSRLGLD